MKKLSSLLMGVILVFIAAQSASALTFTDIKVLDVILAEGPVAQWGHPSSHNYQHNTPGDFEVPFDIVNSASLEISGYYINNNNDEVRVSGETVGRLNSGGSEAGWSFSSWSWVWEDDNPSISTFDITSSFGIWENAGAPLDVEIVASGGIWDGILKVSTSTFTLDYDNATAPAPVPEPATMLLLGTGMAGMAAIRRRRKNKQS